MTDSEAIAEIEELGRRLTKQSEKTVQQLDDADADSCMRGEMTTSEAAHRIQVRHDEDVIRFEAVIVEKMNRNAAKLRAEDPYWQGLSSHSKPSSSCDCGSPFGDHVPGGSNCRRQ